MPGIEDELPATCSDEELIRRCCEGDADCFEVLFERHQRPVYHYARATLRDADAAEDALQETFLSAARAAHSYVQAGRFRAWLMRIARNTCLNRLEAERGRRAVGTLSLDELRDPPSHAATPRRRAELAESLRLVQRAIDALPVQQREAILMLAFEDLTYDEIAQAMQAPINTVKTWIHRARCALAATMEDEQPEKCREL